MKPARSIPGYRARFCAVLGALTVMLWGAASVRAQDAALELAPESPSEAPEATAPANETPEIWFVELTSPPAADGTSIGALRREKAAFRTAAARAGIRFTERFAFDTLWNGLSVRINRGQIPALARVDGVRAIYPGAKFALNSAAGGLSPELASALAMTGADLAQSSLGLTGTGVRVAVIDTGVDVDHPDLGGDGTPDGAPFPNSRIVAGWDFVGDAYNADLGTAPVPDPVPDDCNGHGTHVAGIVGANGAVKGVAPGVSFGAYRVFGCTGTTDSDIMIAAMERALADGMHIVNMSIGAAFQWPQYPTAQASDRLVNKGVVVVTSIGNSGANGLYSASAPGVGKKVVGVASFDNSHVALAKFTISPDAAPIGYGTAAAAPAPPTSGTFPLARTGTATSPADACSPLPAGSLAGKIALIRRGACTFHQKALNAQNAGAVAVVLYNNAAGRFSPTVAGSPPITIPVVAISGVEGALIDSRLASGPVDLTWTGDTFIAPNPTGGLISSFSSYGLTADLKVKPDLGAPGGSIRSTYPLEAGSYASLSGTSMAAPHVAGAAALLLEAKPHTPSQAVGRIFQNHADPKVWWGNPGLGFLDNVHRQGAGMIDIDDAILATTRIEPGELALGESEAGPATRTLTLENNSSADVTYDLLHEPALATGPNTFAPSFLLASASLAASASSVTVPAGGSASVDVTITAHPGLADRSQYGGYVRFNPQGGGAPLRVPYAGFKGDYQSITVLNPTAMILPWLAKLSGASFVNQPAGASFTLVGDDIPFILAHFAHQSRRVRLEVFDAASGKAWHRAFEIEYLGRNSAANSFFALPWDGITVNGKKLNVVPNGTYVIKLSVLKALGDDANPAHWETWTSPPITLARP